MPCTVSIRLELSAAPSSITRRMERFMIGLLMSVKPMNSGRKASTSSDSSTFRSNIM